MAYDPGISAVVLVTTDPQNFACHSYTWTFASGRWTNRTSTTSGAPPVTEDAGLVYDASDGYLLLYGGFDNCTGGVVGTWAFQNHTWRQVATVGHPSVNRWFGMAYDAHDGYVVLFGGFLVNGSTGRSASHETWKYHAGVWSQVSTTNSPAGGALAMLASDPASGGVIDFGGGEPPTPHNGTWL